MTYTQDHLNPVTFSLLTTAERDTLLHDLSLSVFNVSTGFMESSYYGSWTPWMFMGRTPTHGDVPVWDASAYFWTPGPSNQPLLTSVRIYNDDVNVLDVKRVYKDLAKTGAGTGTMIAVGVHTHSGANVNYRVEIDSVGTLTEQDATFRWSDDGGATWDASAIPVASGSASGNKVLVPVALQNAVEVLFTAGTYVNADRWDFVAISTANQISLILANTRDDVLELRNVSISATGDIAGNFTSVLTYTGPGADLSAGTFIINAQASSAATISCLGLEAWAKSAHQVNLYGLQVTLGSTAAQTGLFDKAIGLFIQSDFAPGTGLPALLQGIALYDLNPTGSLIPLHEAFTIYPQRAGAAAVYQIRELGTVGFNVLAGWTSVAKTGDPTVPLDVAGAALFSSTIGVTGAATLNSTLAVTGASTLTGLVTLGAHLKMNATGQIQDSGGSPRITVGEASPNLTLTGDVNIIGGPTTLDGSLELTAGDLMLNAGDLTVVGKGTFGPSATVLTIGVTQTILGTTRPFDVTGTVTATGANQSFFGMSFRPAFSGGTWVTVTGVDSNVTFAGSPVIANFYHVRAQMKTTNPGAGSGSLYGVKVESGGGANWTNVYGLHIAGQVGGTNRYGVQITRPTGGTIGYGLHITGAGGGTTSIALYQDNATGENRLVANLSVGVDAAPTAKLHLGAGTTAAATAPLKFNSGALMTAAEVGAVEFLTDKWYATITTGAARKEFTLNDVALTPGRVPFVWTDGRLIDDADFSFVTDTLTVTKIKAGSVAGYISSDGSTGATGTFTTVDLKTVTTKDGIVVSIV